MPLDLKELIKKFKLKFQLLSKVLKKYQKILNFKSFKNPNNLLIKITINLLIN